MEESEELDLDPSPVANFHAARIEHYLERAEEYVRMARYSAVQKVLEKVYSLDPENSVGQALGESVKEQLGVLQEHARKVFGNGNGTSGDAHHRGRSEIVLVVDQDERVLLALTADLRKSGFKVIAAGGYPEAVETLKIIRPHIIVSEINFESGAVGFDLYHLVRSDSVTADLPFIFLATKIDRGTLIAGKRLGVDDFIEKPLDVEVVIASVVNCISRRRQMKNGTNGSTVSHDQIMIGASLPPTQLS